MEYSNVLYKYIGYNVLNDLRVDKPLPKGLVKDLIKYPLLDFVSEPIKATDKQLILKLFNSSEEYSLLAVFLTRGLPDDEYLTEEMLKLFNNSTEILRKIVIFHELVRRNIDKETRQNLFEFIWSNLDEQLKWAKVFFGSSSSILGSIKERLNNPNFFSKRWVYLINCLAADNQIEARQIIEIYLEDEDAFIKEVASKCLNKCKNII